MKQFVSQNVTSYICQNVLIFMKFYSETVFSHYHITVTPRSDTTLLWSLEWPHAYRDNLTVSETNITSRYGFIFVNELIMISIQFGYTHFYPGGYWLE